MSEHYIQNNTVCIPLDSREWHDYCEFLAGKLEELEEQKKNIEVRISEIHRTLNPVRMSSATDDATSDNCGITPTKVGLNENLVVLDGPSPVVVSAPKEEKYLLAEDIALKYKATSESVTRAAELSWIPGHRIRGEWRFTQSDIEQISSIVARNSRLFTPKKENRDKPKVVINKKPAGKLSASEVCSRLGISSSECALLRKRGLLVGKPRDGKEKAGRGVNLYYDKKEVEALLEMIRMDGGFSSFVAKAKGDSKAS